MAGLTPSWGRWATLTRGSQALSVRVCCLAIPSKLEHSLLKGGSWDPRSKQNLHVGKAELHKTYKAHPKFIEATNNCWGLPGGHPLG